MGWYNLTELTKLGLLVKIHPKFFAGRVSQFHFRHDETDFPVTEY